MKRHIISVKDFQDGNEITTRIASGQAAGKNNKTLELRVIPITNFIIYVVTCNKETQVASTLANAIEIYNSL